MYPHPTRRDGMPATSHVDDRQLGPDSDEWPGEQRRRIDDNYRSWRGDRYRRVPDQPGRRLESAPEPQLPLHVRSLAGYEQSGGSSEQSC
jgi:hypothetical protein